MALLAIQDWQRAPMISLFYGLIFAFIPWLITYLVAMTGWHLVILPAIVCFMLLGPFLAAGLYDVSWEIEKQHKPSLRHSLRAIRRNTVNEWAFGVMLMIFMIFWLRVASLIHALYPAYLDPILQICYLFGDRGSGWCSVHCRCILYYSIYSTDSDGASSGFGYCRIN